MTTESQGSTEHTGTTPDYGAGHSLDSPHGHHHAFPITLRFFGELKRRNLVRVAILYLIACYVVLEPTHLIFFMLEVPVWANRLVIILMAIGLPLVLLFSWVYEITPEGIKPTAEVHPAESITHSTGKKLNRAIIAGLSLAVVLLLADRMWLSRNNDDAKNQVDPAASNAEHQGIPAPNSKAVKLNERSIAVLPFVNMSDDPKQEYFADGITEQILDALTGIPELSVTARTSSFFFKGKQSSLEEISHALGVVHILEGSVRKSGKMIRITAQLIRADNGFHLWSKTFDRQLDDIFRIQDEIAATVASALKVSLVDGSTQKIKGTQSVEAFTLTMQAEWMREHADTKEDRERVVQVLRRALKLDPNYANAWTVLSGVMMMQADGSDIPAAQAWEDIRKAAERAVELDPNFPGGHNALATLYFRHDWNWSAAEAQFRLALALDPNRPGTMQTGRNLYMTLGDIASAKAFAVKELEVDPMDPSSHIDLGWILFLEGSPADAITEFQSALKLDSKYRGAHAVIGYVLLAQGKSTEALAEIDQENDEANRDLGRVYAYFALGRTRDSNLALGEFESKHSETDAYAIAQVHAFRGERDAAFRWLNRAYVQRDTDCSGIKLDWDFKNLRDDHRFKAFLERMKLPT
jgi:adenylate cyclase